MPKDLPKINHQILGNRIKTIRISKGYTSQEAFAYKHEISRTQYARYEKGINISFDNLLRVMNALGVTPKEFFSEGFEGLESK